VKAALSRIGQSGSHEGVTYALPPTGSRHFGMPEVEGVVAEYGIEERRLAICEWDEEALALRVVLNVHGASASVRYAAIR
jgi:hypothetical protein